MDTFRQTLYTFFSRFYISNLSLFRYLLQVIFLETGKTLLLLHVNQLLTRVYAILKCRQIGRLISICGRG